MLLDAAPLVLAVPLGDVPEPTVYQPGSDPRLGFHLGSWWNFGEQGKAVWEGAVQDLYDHGVRQVSFVALALVDPATGELLTRDEMTADESSRIPELADIAAGVARAGELGMSVCVNPIIEHRRFFESPWPWRGELEFATEEAATTFFAEYQVFVTEAAEVAEEYGAQQMTIGSELRRLTTNPDYAAHWTSLIDGVDAVFHGQLGYAADYAAEFDEYNDPIVVATIWDHPKIDFLGVNVSCPLATEAEADASQAHPDPQFIATVADNWQEIAGRVITLAAARKGGSGMPTIFNEVGLTPYNMGSTQPYSGAFTVEDSDEQVNAFDALLRATDSLGALLPSIYVWNWGMPGNGDNRWSVHPEGEDDANPGHRESLGNPSGQFLTGYVTQPAGPTPQAFVDTFEIEVNAVLSVASPGVLVNDQVEGGATMAAWLIGRPKHGVVSLDVDGGFRYEPAPGFVGTDEFTYLATTGQADSEAVTVTLRVLPTELGTVEDFRLDNLQPSEQGHWYSFGASRDAILTVEAICDLGAGSCDLTLYDQDMLPLANSEIVGGHPRIDWNSGVQAGQRYHLKVAGTNPDVDLRLVNLVGRTGSAVVVNGTGAVDQFAFDASANLSVAVNGMTYAFALGEIATIAFDGAGGEDIAAVMCSAEDESVVLYPDRGTIKGPSCFVTLASIEHKTVDAGGGAKDVVKISGSNGDDTFTAGPAEGSVLSPGYSTRAVGFDNLSAYARVGDDLATFAGSDGPDTFVGRPSYSNLFGPGFYVGAQEFDEVTVQSVPGGGDSAYFMDSDGDETLIANPDWAVMTGASFGYLAIGFDAVRAYARSGGVDAADLIDGPGDDTFDAYPDYATLHGPGLWIQARYFDVVKAHADGGGLNTAHFFDSPGDDTFEARPHETKMDTPKADNYAYDFLVANAYGYQGGTDTAHLYGTAGNDTFKFYGNAAPMYGRLTARIAGGALYDRLVKAFDNLYAYGEDSGTDIAYLYDSAGDDSFLGKPDESRLSGSGYLAVANAFDEVHAQASDGNDTAELNDSEWDDALNATTTSIKLASNNAYLGYLYEVLAFDSVTAKSTTGRDTKNIAPGVDNLMLVGAWE